MAVQGQIEETISGLGVDKRRSTAAGNNSNTTKATTIATYTDRAAMETYLLAHGVTQAQLNSMNLNDITFAVRLKQDAAGV